MKRLMLTNFSLRFPWLVLVLVIGAVFLFGSQFSKVHFDNDPENMLAPDEVVRVFHHQVKKRFSLYDFVIVGIVNNQNPDGIFNVETLSKIDKLTHQLLSLRPGKDGAPEVVSAPGSNEYLTLNLLPDKKSDKVLNAAFSHDPHSLFKEDGTSVIIGSELISPSVVDNIKQAELGSLKIEYLMENVPKTRDEALVIRKDAMSNPLYKGTLVAEDGKAICIYIPISEKTYSYNIANLVKELTKDWGEDDQVHITGLPVAEDTFGVEMLVQMATSAPLAGLAIFLLLLLFFRRVSLIIAPMFVAVISIVCTMGLLIGLGFAVHIMSSMIAIFLMPIAVADAVHILSEFFDVYHRFNDKKKTLQYVVGHLFMPMLYTSLTTIAGFASLATTPIPPVRIFGLHVAFGVAIAWLLTMTFVPAFILLFIPEKTMRKLSQPAASNENSEISKTLLDRFLYLVGKFSYSQAKIIIIVAAVVMVVSILGVTRINVNDNPVKWFTKEHPVRLADRILNAHFGGTYTAYLTLKANTNETFVCSEIAQVIKGKAEKDFKNSCFLEAFLEEIRKAEDHVCDLSSYFDETSEIAKAIDVKALTSWNNLADGINYLDPVGLTKDSLAVSVREMHSVDEKDKQVLMKEVLSLGQVKGEALLDRALMVCEQFTSISFESLVQDIRTEFMAPAFKRPDVLRYLNGLQRHLDGIEVVGKTSSAVDALKKASYELLYEAPDASVSEADMLVLSQRNDANFAVPESAAAAGQVYIQLEGMKKKDTLFHLVTRDYQEANIWVQLTSGDNQDMQVVVQDVERYIAEHEPPVSIAADWAGLTYLNIIWQDKMVKGMFSSLASSFIVVLIMMIILFRSPLFGTLAMIPLSLTILFIYGVIGWTGKDYDMPVAVLSSMTLGLSVDFAIHFLQRAREERKRFGSWKAACEPMFREPAKAISRNAITISIGFTPLLLAPLVPYRTVGFFLATIMAISWITTMLVLPALLTVLRRMAFGNITGNKQENTGDK